jgi:hypothetical protein
MCDEQYSPDMAEWVAAQLAKAPPKILAQLVAYYQQRGGPGLALALAEQDARKQSKTTQNATLQEST